MFASGLSPATIDKSNVAGPNLRNLGSLQHPSPLSIILPALPPLLVPLLDHPMFSTPWRYTHEKTESADVVLNQYVPPAVLATMAPAVDLELEPGQMSLHDVNLIHGSNRNTSPRRRAGVAYRYMPTTSHFDRQLFSSDAAGGYVGGLCGAQFRDDC